MRLILPPEDAEKRVFYTELLSQLGVDQNGLKKLELDEANQVVTATHENGARFPVDLKGANQPIARAALCNMGVFAFCARRQEPHRITYAERLQTVGLAAA